VLVVIVGVAIVAVAVFGWRKAKEFEQTLHDPEKRTETVLDVLRTDGLPDGWRPVFAGSIPLLGEMAMLTSGATIGNADAFELGERGFVYVQTIGGKAEDIRRRFEQGDDLRDAFRGANLRFNLDRELARGSSDVDGGVLMWLSGTGRAEVQGAAIDGLKTLAAIDCEQDRRTRYLFWWEPAPVDLDDPAALSGTIADGDRLGRFLAPFALCPG
jgi:hypothetical protein